MLCYICLSIHIISHFHKTEDNAIKMSTFLFVRFLDLLTVQKRNTRTTLDLQLRDGGCQVRKTVYINGHFKSYEWPSHMVLENTRHLANIYFPS